MNEHVIAGGELFANPLVITTKGYIQITINKEIVIPVNKKNKLE